MPYTPPSQRSPASSGPSSPEGSRRPSFHQPRSSSSRPALPRSASYLTRHRRTPSVTQASGGQPSPEATSEDLKSMVTGNSVRQSPPPITGVRGMPSGAIMSPPDSASDDDDLPEVRGRRIENLKELHDAVSQIPQHRARRPSDGATAHQNVADAGDLRVLPSQASTLTEGMHHSFSTGSLDELGTGGNRRFNHTRSATEPHISINRSTGSSTAGSDEDSDEERQRKPQMVRKKSGELVRPALRPASRRRPSSMPGTPTFSKAVHFDSHLEHVRHFLQVDRPLAVSAGSSPVDNYESDTEYPFSSDQRTTTRALPFEWEIIMTNFPVETPVRKAQPVRLEKVWLSPDQKTLVGSVAVANLAFQKLVACRFTLDYWKTTSEVVAEYVCGIHPVETAHSQDRFNFSIKLSDLAYLESKTLYFCIRYMVSGQEYWDNNNGTNFQIDFRKKMLPQNGKRGAIGAANRPLNGLPKSNRRSGQKSKQASTTSDEFGDGQKLNFDKSIHDYLGESGSTGLRLKNVKSTGDLPSDNLSKGLSGPSGQFALRYDFGDSLSRAIQSAKNDMAGRSDGLYMKSRKKTGSPTAVETGSENKTAQAPASSTTVGHTTTAPAESPSASISSASYEEIVNKWCFYGSKPRGQTSKFKTGSFESSDDASSSTASYDGSPVQMSNYSHLHSGTQPHLPHPRDPSPYFSHMPIHGGMGHAPAESHLGQRATSPPSESTGSSVQQQAAAKTFAHLAGTSPNEYSYQRSHDRFPFYGTETHAPAAIRS
ncbi:carbohydrate-binding module family 21 protein [Corynascus novoguineensis]|uniref:Carbohydrate-binding module family 21 protein n=1 Tax=Corynascus novoguineensis TaxID=1126955 RepID=A0AAN7HFZ3_9PEZI|nr:carbohydrate-binding module family 21 protein [Corynascus novoguineensis]